MIDAAIEAAGRAARFTLRILLGRPATPVETGREGKPAGDAATTGDTEAARNPRAWGPQPGGATGDTGDAPGADDRPGTGPAHVPGGGPESGGRHEVPDPRTSPPVEGAETPGEMCPALRLLVRLGGELAAAGVDAQIRRDLHALAVPTVKPGTYIWIYPDAARQRFLCYLNDLCEHLTGDPQTAARDIAAFARAGRYRRPRRHVSG